MRLSWWNGSPRRRVDRGKTPGRRQRELNGDIREARWGVEVDHRLPRPRLWVEQDGVPGDDAIIRKGPLVVQVRIPEDQLAVRCRIAHFGVDELVEAGDLLPE